MRCFVVALTVTLHAVSAVAQSRPVWMDVTVAGDVVQLTWTATAGRFTLEAGSAPGAADLAVVPVTTNTLTVQGVTPGTYFARIRTDAGVSPDAHIVVPPCPTTLLPPSGLRASVTGATVRVAWARSPSCHIQYRLLAGLRPGASDVAIDLGTADTYTVEAPRGLYHVRVVAVSGAAVSAPTNEIAVAPGFDTADAFSAPATVHVVADTVTYAPYGGYMGLPPYVLAAGEVRNNTGAPIYLATTSILIKSGSGAILDHVTANIYGPQPWEWYPGASTFNLLAPGERGCFAARTAAPIAAAASADLAVTYRPVAALSPMRGTVALSAPPVHESRFGFSAFRGEVRNTGAFDASSVVVGVTIKSPAGAVLECYHQYVGTLAPGQSAPYDFETLAPFSSANSVIGRVTWSEP